MGLPERTDLLENLVLNFSRAILFTNLKWDGGVLVLGIADFLDLEENYLEVLEDPTSFLDLLDMMKIKKKLSVNRFKPAQKNIKF